MNAFSRGLLAASVLALGAAAPAMAKTFVYCSEGSPESYAQKLVTAVIRRRFELA